MTPVLKEIIAVHMKILCLFKMRVDLDGYLDWQ